MTDFSNYYRIYMQMQELLKGDFTYNYITKALADEDGTEDVHAGKMYSRVIDMDWVEAIEDALVYVDKAIREQRRFIEQHEDIVPIEKARKITNESIRHLSQHTNLIARVEGDSVTPERILDIQREESFSIYENRFLHTLLNNVIRFVEERYRNLKTAPTDSYSKLSMKRRVVLNRQVLDFDISYANESHERLKVDLTEDISTLTDFERVLRIRRVLSDFMAAPLMRTLSKSEPVRPPILRTNLMTKNPNFKKALDLWLFIETYKKPGYDVVGNEYTGKMEEEVQQGLYGVMSFQHFVISIATNPARKKLLHEKYLEENARMEEELRGAPDRERKKLEEFRIQQVREEEMQARLEVVRDREKQISLLRSNVNSQRITIKQREEHIKELEGSLNLCGKTIKKQREDMLELDRQLKESQELVKQKEEHIAAQADDISGLKTEISRHLAVIAGLEQRKIELEAKIEWFIAEKNLLEENLEISKQTIFAVRQQVDTLTEEIQQKSKTISQFKLTVEKQDIQIREGASVIELLHEDIAGLKTNMEAENQRYTEDISNLKMTYKLKSEQKQEEHLRTVAEMESAFQAERQAIRTAAKEESKRLNHTIAKLETTKDRELKELQIKQAAKLKRVKSDYDKQLQLDTAKMIAQAQEEIKDIKHKAKVKIKEALASANQKNAEARQLKKLARNTPYTAFMADYPIGAAGIQALQTNLLTERGTSPTILMDTLLKTGHKIVAVYVLEQGKNRVIYSSKNGELKLIKAFKNTEHIGAILSNLSDLFVTGNKAIAFVTHQSMDKTEVEDICNTLKQALSFSYVAEKQMKKRKKVDFKQFGIYYIKE